MSAEWTIVSVAAILFGAALLQATTGFGMAIVCMALLPLVLPVNEAIAFVTTGCLVATVFIMIANHSGLSFRHAGPLAIGMCLGIPIGYYGLRSLDGDLVVRLLGVALMGIAVFEILRSRFISLPIPEKSGSLFGLAGGILAGAFNVGGPPLVVYAYSRPWSKVETVAILQSVFITAGLTRNLLMAQAGEITPDLLRLVAWSLPGAALAVWLGKRILDRLPMDLLRRIVFGLIFLIGVKYVVQG